MATPIDWHGTNRRLGPPKDMDETSCSYLPVFTNGVNCVLCWELTDAEIAEIIRTRQVFLSVWSGVSQPPVLIGSETVVRDACSDRRSIIMRRVARTSRPCFMGMLRTLPLAGEIVEFDFCESIMRKPNDA
jgi:hypothetical protein